MRDVRYPPGVIAKETPMSTATYTVTGMTCGHCVSSVTEEVEQIPGVTAVDVDLETGRVTVTSDTPVDDAKVKDAVEEAGYQLQS
jgi:copper ion binding protein